MSGYTRVLESEVVDDGEVAAPLATLPVTRSLLSSLHSLVTGGPVSVPPSEASRAFSASLRATCGSSGNNVPAFFPGSYHEALDAGRRERKAVLLYLHSSLHPDSLIFVRDVICGTGVRAACENGGGSVIAWAGDVAEGDAWEAAAQMGAAAFPFVGIYAHVGIEGSVGGSGSYKRLWAHEGAANLTAETLITMIREIGTRVAAPPPPPRAPMISAEQRLRQEQDREYLAGLAADETAAAAEAIILASATAAAAAAAEATAVAADAAELEEAVRMSIELDKEGSMALARARLAANPEPPSENASAAAIVRVALPSGARVQRGFSPHAPLSLVADFALVASAELGTPLPVDGFDLRTAMPRMVYDCHSKGGAESKKSLTELGLARGASVMVSLV